MLPTFFDRFTFASKDLWLSEFRLAPDHPDWHATHRTTDDVALIAFPRTSVAIRHEQRREVIADPLSAVVYSPGQAYARRLVSAVGDDCTILAVRTDLAAEVARDFDPGAEPGTYRFPFVAGALEREDFATVQRIHHHLTRDADHEAVHEELLWLLRMVIASGYRESGVEAKRSTAVHVELAEAVREELGRELGDSSSLSQLADKLAVSPFHLVRVFRSVTHRPIHAYRTELRLRSSLPLIASGMRLADVAQQLGFASHAHLTNRFVRAFGITPLRWRETSKNVEAREGRAFLA